VKTFANFAFLAEVLFARNSTWNRFRAPRHLGTSHATRANRSHMSKSSLVLTMALFAYFQHDDSNPDGPLLTAVLVLTIRTANEVIPVLDLSSTAEGEEPYADIQAGAVRPVASPVNRSSVAFFLVHTSITTTALSHIPMPRKICFRFSPAKETCHTVSTSYIL